tara:strand:- start:405 stop:524 length:120 start_codon:yes stop_codon:yes gene_type:complete
MPQNRFTTDFTFGLDFKDVSSDNLVPKPPAKITAFTLLS